MPKSSTRRRRLGARPLAGMNCAALVWFAGVARAEEPVQPSNAQPADTVAAPDAASVPEQAPIEVIVRGAKPSRSPAPGATSLSQTDVRDLPGAFGDPFRAIEAQPGVVPVFSAMPYFFVPGPPPATVGSSLP